ncbi:MAG TPA: ABC-2 transporter permease [Candidatus Kapabacteria bacterium]|nr:ABC-2 transporter permease [Candidatus Kapabacteria bacterium]HPO62474.1 ABC-2 transporter permease [Candidatus Kapabacteria bacterium]
MKFGLLLSDEFNGFYKSKVMVAMWIGLPLLSLILYWFTPSTKEMSFSFFFASLIASFGGTLASIMLTVNIIHEISRKVYDLFLIRPIKRSDILISKYFAVFLCTAIAIILSLAFGVGLDFVKNSALSENILLMTAESFGLSLASIAVSCSIGIFIGIISPTVLMGIILIIFVAGNFTSLILYLPTMLQLENAYLITILSSIVFSALLVFISILIFNKKQF